MQTVNIEITNRRATVVGAPVLICNNTGDVVKFTFDDEWADAVQKTACFVYIREGKAFHQDVEFTGDTAEIPPLSNIREVKIGVYAGALTTTTAARVPCEPSVLCGSGETEMTLIDAGRQAEYDKFWDNYQRNGTRTVYCYAFCRANGWNDECYNPKYPLRFEVNAQSGTYVFQYSLITDTKVPIVCVSGTLNSCFASATKLKTIPSLTVDNATTFGDAFYNCSALENITMYGTIGRNINFQYSPLTVESMKSIILCLADYSGTDKEFVYTITFSEDCWAALLADGSLSPNGNDWRNYCFDIGWNT